MEPVLKEKEEVKWDVEGMTCNSCATTISRYLENRGMKKVMVDYATGKVQFESPDTADRVEIARGVEKLGYHVASIIRPQKGFFSRIFSTIEGKFFFCLAFTAPLLLHMLLPWKLLHDPWFQFALSLPVFLVGLFHFGKSSWFSLKEGTTNMDVLIFLGSTAAFVYSVVGTLVLKNPDYLFFETTASIITLVLLGNVIEKRSVRQTRSAVTELTKLQPQKARQIHFYGDPAFEVISEVDVAAIRVGDYFLVNTGDRIPADGQVVWGRADLDESMLTGESLPVERSIGQSVITGTIVKDGIIKIQAKATGDDTALFRIIELVSTAQRNRPRIQKLADRITAVFVPVVLAISAAAFLLGWIFLDFGFQQALMNSIAVLVIACPCAMGLATPTAVMVGVGRAARAGILVKGAQSLETLSKVKSVVFDKTGTLTTGRFRIGELKAKDIDESHLKRIIYTLEQHSAHPIAMSLVAELQGMPPLAMREISEQKGISVSAEDEQGNRYKIGSARILEEQEVDPRFNVFVKRNGQLIGSLALADDLRPEALPAIRSLRQAGIRTILLSGDHEMNCRYVAKTLGIDEYYSEKLPEEKMKIMEELRKTQAVAMVGDGVNDAPALSAATIGISLSHATQVAIDSAEVILLQSDLNLLPQSLLIAKHTMKTIRQNLFWAFFYNTLAIPIAAAGWLRPMVAAFSMAFSDVVVVGNSLRLRTKKLK